MNQRRPDQLRRLPIDVRPVAGERVEFYVRRLARANHLRPSYLRRFLVGPPGWNGAITPQRLAALTGRPVAVLQQTLSGKAWPGPERPPSGYLRRRHADKPALYAKIRIAAEIDNPTMKELSTRFRVGSRTVVKALSAPEPPPWKPPHKKTPPAYAASIDALLDVRPGMTVLQLWEQLVDHTDFKVSYTTVQAYLKRRRDREQLDLARLQHASDHTGADCKQ
jgi:hypothetical protein